jgi:arginase
MRVCLIEVPYMAGDEDHPAAEGPPRYVEAARELLGARGAFVSVKRVERVEPGPFPDVPTASLGVAGDLAGVVRDAVAAGQLPVVLAGSCDASLGVLAGLERADCGIVWIDAHADFNTPESSVSGFFPGMSLATITGHCYGGLWSQIGGSTPIAEGATVLLGVRDLSPEAERERLERSAVRVVGWRDGRQDGDPAAALDELATCVDDVYLHIDNDAFDPEVAPGIVDHPLPGGLSLEDMEKTIREVRARFRILAAALTTYVPRRDRDERTLRAGLRVLELLAVDAA